VQHAQQFRIDWNGSFADTAGECGFIGHRDIAEECIASSGDCRTVCYLSTHEVKHMRGDATAVRDRRICPGDHFGTQPLDDCL